MREPKSCYEVLLKLRDLLVTAILCKVDMRGRVGNAELRNAPMQEAKQWVERDKRQETTARQRPESARNEEKLGVNVLQ